LLFESFFPPPLSQRRATVRGRAESSSTSGPTHLLLLLVTKLGSSLLCLAIVAFLLYNDIGLLVAGLLYLFSSGRILFFSPSKGATYLSSGPLRTGSQRFSYFSFSRPRNWITINVPLVTVSRFSFLGTGRESFSTGPVLLFDCQHLVPPHTLFCV